MEDTVVVSTVDSTVGSGVGVVVVVGLGVGVVSTELF